MIEFTAEQIEKAERMLEHIPGAAPKAMARALNRAAESAKTEAGRKVRESYYVKSSDVSSTIKIYKASETDLNALVISRGNLMPLMKFRVTPRKPTPNRKKPIVARVKRGSGGPIKHAFVARMNSGHIGVFTRAGKQRIPINENYGPSIPEMLNSESVSAWVEQKATETLDKRLDHEISRILKGEEN